MAYKVYINPETPTLFAPGAFGSGIVFNAMGLATGAGVYSSSHDLGAGPRAWLYEWRAQVIVDGPPDAGASVDFYLATGDGTITDASLTGSSAALDDIARVVNLKFLGSAVVPAVSGAEVTIVTSGLVAIHARHIRVVVVNRTGASLKNASNCCLVYLTPVPDEQQS